MVVLYSIIDLAVFGAALVHFQTYSMYTLREVSSAVLRTWLLIELCRRILADYRWTRRLMLAALLSSALLLVGAGFPVFVSEQSTSSAYLGMGVYFRTVYFAQVGVIAVLFLMSFRSLEANFTRELGIAIGLATASGAELVSLTLRGRSDLGTPYAYISLNYIGMITATAIWIMFVNAKTLESKIPPQLDESEVPNPRRLSRAAD